MSFSPNRIGKEEEPREALIRKGEMNRVLEGLRNMAKEDKGISIVFHDVRPAGTGAHTGTHARAHVTPDELEQILKAIQQNGYAYETFEHTCKYRGVSFDKPDSLL